MSKKESPKTKINKTKKPTSKADPNQKTNELLQLILDEVSAIGDMVANLGPKEPQSEDSPDTSEESA